ncbi:MAG: glutamyl-tRNA(Gln) amidotransferase subunit D [Candidatus Micrarchaeota archaeon]|nr:MAG: glutamyl-tRNA(Gln) amidotransferase subunit D [Candidatus Micrarchaeota archaeon]
MNAYETLRSKGISLSDIIEIKWRGIEIKGELMPSSEVNGEDIIILKLENGYNIGVSISEIEDIKRISSGSKIESFPEAKLEGSSNKKIAIVTTGGTIGSRVDYKTGGVYMLLKPEQLLYNVQEINSIAKIELSPLFSIASEDMTYIEWQKIAKEAERLSREEDIEGIIVTIGTDTMHYASAALSFMLKEIKLPIVLTGAQRSSDRGSSDAFMNLICSSYIALSDIAEVGVCMHASSSDDRCHFIRGTKARKMHTSRRDAFRPINDLPIAEVDTIGNIIYKSSYRKKDTSDRDSFKALVGFERKVALVKMHPNIDPSIISYYTDKGYKGIIIEGTGLGHVAISTEHKEFNWKESIKYAIDNGVIIGMTSQCLYGRVNDSVYRNLRIISGLGVIYCEDMLPETALVKLSWLLGNFKEEDAKQLLNKNLVGEISDRTRFHEFMN